MKKILLVIISASILIAPINAMAAVKAGDACKKAGSTATVNGKKFTCIKSGKKLVWNKGVGVPGAKPTVIPIPRPTPIPSVEPTVTPTRTPTPTIAPFVPPYIPRTFQELENKLSGIIYGA